MLNNARLRVAIRAHKCRVLINLRIGQCIEKGSNRDDRK